MKSLLLFTDGSAHPMSRIGYGAYLAIPDLNADLPESEAIDNLRMQIANNASGSTLEPRVQLKRFEDTSSSQLEIETLIWALRELQPKAITVYTDSQNIIGLPGRRNRFEEQGYLTQQNKPVKHAELYQEFFRLTDQIGCTFVKVKGHRVSHQKTELDHLFTLVDRASRRALRDHLRSDP